MKPLHSAVLVSMIVALWGCSLDTPVENERQGTPQPGAIDEVSQLDKERHAADLGDPTTSVLGPAGVRSMSAAAAAPISIPFGPEPGPFANSAGLFCDDCARSGVPIGFSFTFFGNAYTTFDISSNGFIGFSPLDPPAGCCTGGSIPSADSYNNLIAAAWTDLYPPGGGGIFYETRGRAPNRYLVVSYQNLPWYREFGTNRVTTQIILYEGTNDIEIHTTNQSAGHTYTQGVENASGSVAEFVPGRVAANYGLTNDAVRFTTAVSNFWTARSPLPTARRNLAVGTAAGLLYAIGGTNGAGAALTTVQSYNPASNAWSSRAALPAARHTGNGAATITGTIYIAGGQDAAKVLTRTLYAYSSSNNTWSTKANMPVASGCGGSATINGKLYVFSGCTRSSTGSQVAAGLLHRYDPTTNAWTALRTAPAVHFQPVVGVLNGKLYVVGGNNASSVAINRVDVYDPGTNLWSTRAAMPTARVGAAGTAVAGKLYVVGGRSGTTSFNTAQVYDPVSGSWAGRAAMPTARSAHGAGVINNLLYMVGGGTSTTVLANNERFTP